MQTNPKFTDRARKAARARWAKRADAPKTVRLDDLTPEQRRLVLALVSAAKAEGERAA